MKSKEDFNSRGLFETQLSRAFTTEKCFNLEILESRVKLAIKNNRKHSLIIKLGIFGSLALFTFVGFLTVLYVAGQQIISSPLSELVQMMFSDLILIKVAWQEFLMSLVESLPVVPLVSILLALLILLVIVKFAYYYLSAYSILKRHYEI